MSRADSNPAPGGPVHAAPMAGRGFTLVEVLVALAASGILISALAMFFKGFNRSFNTQEQVSDRDLNAHYAVKRLSEALMGAGANLPAKDWEVVSLPEGNPGPHLKLSVNPRGGVQYVSSLAVGVNEVPIDDPKGFAKAAYILIDPQDDNVNPYKVAIDASYNSAGFVDGIKAATPSAVRLASGVTLQVGDMFYALDEEDYRLQDGNLMLGDMVLAENFQDLKLTFMTADQVPTGQWSAMRSARVDVTAKTRVPDPGYADNGGYRSVSLSMDVLLRNRL